METKLIKLSAESDWAPKPSGPAVALHRRGQWSHGSGAFDWPIQHQSTKSSLKTNSHDSNPSAEFNYFPALGLATSQPCPFLSSNSEDVETKPGLDQRRQREIGCRFTQGLGGIAQHLVHCLSDATNVLRVRKDETHGKRMGLSSKKNYQSNSWKINPLPNISISRVNLLVLEMPLNWVP